MNEKEIEKLKFPIGKYKAPEEYSASLLLEWIKEIEDFPIILKEAVRTITPAQLETPYRTEGWTARQVVHHLADSHMNAFIRFKLALTEDKPVIKPYHENKWANLADAYQPIIHSLQIIEAIHARWVAILKNMSAEDFQKTYTHPQYNKIFTLAYALGLYAWHGKHHLAHIQLCMQSS